MLTMHHAAQSYWVMRGLMRGLMRDLKYCPMLGLIRGQMQGLMRNWMH